MIVTRESAAGVIAVRPAGRMGLGPALDRFRRVLDELELEGRRRIVLELSDVTFLDSASLGEIMAAHKRVRALGGRVVLAGAGGKVHDLLELTRLGELIDVYPDLDGAVQSFVEPPNRQ